MQFENGRLQVITFVQCIVVLLKFHMKMFVNMARLDVGQLFTQSARQGHPCTLDTILVLVLFGEGVQGISRNAPLSGPGYAKICLTPYANNKGADQPAHPRSLISTFVVRCLDNMICMLALSKVSRF